MRHGVSFFVLQGVALLAVLSCAGCEAVLPEQPVQPNIEQPILAPPREEIRDLTIAEKAILADGFTAGMDNPDSVKFRWAKVPKGLSEHSFEYCGLINVKKYDGKYLGMRPFLATITTDGRNITGGAVAALNSNDSKENQDVIPKLCMQKGLNPFDAK
jgi:hypothetical protein